MKQVVLIENDINTRPFSTQVLACLPPLPWTLSAEDLANPNRQDLRQVRVFSVDPPGNFDQDTSNLLLFYVAGSSPYASTASQVVETLMMHYIARYFQMGILKLESVSLNNFCCKFLCLVQIYEQIYLMFSFLVTFGLIFIYLILF